MIVKAKIRIPLEGLFETGPNSRGNKLIVTQKTSIRHLIQGIYHQDYLPPAHHIIQYTIYSFKIEVNMEEYVVRSLFCTAFARRICAIIRMSCPPCS